MSLTQIQQTSMVKEVPQICLTRGYAMMCHLKTQIMSQALS